MALSREDVAEQLGGQQVARGRRVSRRAPGAKRTPKGAGGRQAVRRVQDDQFKCPEPRAARKAPSSLDCAEQSGAGVAEWAWARCCVCGAVVDTRGAAA